MSEQGRPTVRVSALTANTITLEVETANGLARLIVGHETLTISQSGGLTIEVQS